VRGNKSHHAIDDVGGIRHKRVSICERGRWAPDPR